MTEGQTPGSPKKAGSGWLNLAIDYGPLVVFFIAYKYFSRGQAEIYGVIRGTIAFMLASFIALALSKWRLGKISPMLWLSTLLIVGFGLVTILLRDKFWIQVKPTAIYVLFGVVLLVGYMRGRAVLQWLLEAAFDGLSHEGWMKLSRNWGWFFLFLAILNEVLRHFLTFGEWLAAKIWVFLPLSFLFTFLHLPMLMRHGLGAESKEEEETTLPP